MGDVVKLAMPDKKAQKDQLTIEEYGDRILELGLRINPLVEELIRTCSEAEELLMQPIFEKQHAIHMKMELAELLARYVPQSPQA